MSRGYFARLRDGYKTVLSVVGALFVLLPMFLLDKSSAFPGYNALLVCIGAGLVVAFPSSSKASVTRIFSNKALVWVGLISYPLYLFHQPIISFLAFSNPDYPVAGVLLIVFSISILMSWVTYRYIELPVRSYVKRGPKMKRRVLTAGLVASIPFFAVSGFAVAKSGGVPERFKLLNPFAMDVAEAHGASFHRHYDRGFVVSENSSARVLFVGDSVLQQYVYPMISALDIDRTQADFVTRGGCVLLKGVDFKDQFSDISCDGLRHQLYSLEKKYDLVVVSQSWEGYESSLINAPEGVSGIERWEPFLAKTISHFKKYAEEVVLVGGHLRITGVTGIQPSVQISRESLNEQIKELRLENREIIMNAGAFFSRFSDQHSVRVINPYEIFCKGEACELTDGVWSYFSDSQHISFASSDFVTTKLKGIFAAKTSMSAP